MTADALLLAHQGGWDEILLILTPIAIFAALLGLANRRANAEVRGRGGKGTADEETGREPGPIPPDGSEEVEADDQPPPGRGGGPSPP